MAHTIVELLLMTLQMMVIAVLMKMVFISLFQRASKMKLITAIIKPFKLQEVREALVSSGVEGLTISEVKGYGRQKGHTELYRGAEYTVDTLPKIKLEIATRTENCQRVVEAITKIASTGKIGDGKIFVYDLDQIVRIRTGELDEEAI